MPKNKVSDPITDQEIAFARLVLSGTMTDRHAAEAVGLNPGSAAYTKSKPRVRAYMLEHRAAVQKQLVQQEAEGLHRLNLDREQVLDRLWEIANLSPEMTRGSVTGQVKALSMIMAMENFIPDRRAVSSEKKSPPAPAPQIYAAAWLREQQATTIDPQPSPAPPVPACRGAQRAPEPQARSRLGGRGASGPWPQQSTFTNPSSPSETLPSVPYAPVFRFCSRHESSFLWQKEPLCPPPLSCQSSKRTKKYQILQMTGRLRVKLSGGSPPHSMRGSSALDLGEERASFLRCRQHSRADVIPPAKGSRAKSVCVRTQPAEVSFLAEAIRNWTGAPGSPKRTWAEKGAKPTRAFYDIH